MNTLGRVIQLQFGAFGRQPWFIEDTPGAQFVKRAYQDVPFVKTYLVPLNAFVGVEFGMDLTEQGWRHLDYDNYGPGEVDDTEYARLYRERDSSKVVTREMVAASIAAQEASAASEETAHDTKGVAPPSRYASLLHTKRDYRAGHAPVCK